VCSSYSSRRPLPKKRGGEKVFITGQPSTGENDDYNDENSWISEGRNVAVAEHSCVCTFHKHNTSTMISPVAGPVLHVGNLSPNLQPRICKLILQNLSVAIGQLVSNPESSCKEENPSQTRF